MLVHGFQPRMTPVVIPKAVLVDVDAELCKVRVQLAVREFERDLTAYLGGVVGREDFSTYMRRCPVCLGSADAGPTPQAVIASEVRVAAHRMPEVVAMIVEELASPVPRWMQGHATSRTWAPTAEAYLRAMDQLVMIAETTPPHMPVCIVQPLPPPVEIWVEAMYAVEHGWTKAG